VAASIVGAGTLAGQGAAQSAHQADDAAGFAEFSVRVQAYLTLQKQIASNLPELKPTDLPEMIAAHQQVLARKIREARPHEKAGNLFTKAACKAFRRASYGALGGPRSAGSRAYMRPGEASPGMRLTINDVYPDTEPITAIPPALLAAFPQLPEQVAYRVVGRTLVVIDRESRLVVDIARDILPPV
jgi:hypothetical protein